MCTHARAKWYNKRAIGNFWAEPIINRTRTIYEWLLFACTHRDNGLPVTMGRTGSPLQQTALYTEYTGSPRRLYYTQPRMQTQKSEKRRKVETERKMEHKTKPQATKRQPKKKQTKKTANANGQI